MAIHANSTPTPERLLLRDVAAPGRLLPWPITPAHALDLLAINERIAALFNPAEIGEDEPGDFDGPLFETMRECQDDELASLQAQRAEIEAKREADLLAILDMGPIDPAALALLSKAQRKRVQAGIDALIGFLDAVTPDADLEPSLGSCNAVPPGLRLPQAGPVRHFWPMADHLAFAHGGADDLEEVDEDGDTLDDGEEDTSDREPSLGAPEIDMRFRGGWGVTDRRCSQARWTEGGCDDRELGDDNGLADMDGLCEQVRQYDGCLPWSNGGYVA